MCLIGLALALGTPASGETAAELAKQGIHECEQGQIAPTRDEKVAHYTRGQKLGEQAVALDDNNAAAHFAIFCNLGESLRVDGEKITSILGFRQMMRELDRTLELDPNNLDAVSAKGTLLVRLPTLLGGDAPTGEKMLERVVREDSGCINARITLAEIYSDRGERADAVALAAQARELARSSKRADKIAKAEAELEKLQATPGEITAGLAITHCPGQPGVSCPPKIKTAAAQPAEG